MLTGSGYCGQVSGNSRGAAIGLGAVIAMLLALLDKLPLCQHLHVMTKPPLTILLAAPRGFCAGVVRAIDIVERALALYGKPVYVRHEIVHNTFVVDDLKAKGAIFVDELDEIPDGDWPVVFSAHGVPKSVPAAAAERRMFQIDATCPLVTKVHMEARRHHDDGLDIILIGHKVFIEWRSKCGAQPFGLG